MFADDEPDILVIVKIALEVKGFEVEVCDSGIEAIEKAPSFNPDLFLLDVMMPGKDGPATMQTLRQMPQTASTPVIFITARVQPHEIAHYKELGVIEVIPKPFNPLSLATQIREAMKWPA